VNTLRGRLLAVGQAHEGMRHHQAPTHTFTTDDGDIAVKCKKVHDEATVFWAERLSER
jgi:hypothetical protein